MQEGAVDEAKVHAGDMTRRGWRCLLGLCGCFRGCGCSYNLFAPLALLPAELPLIVHFLLAHPLSIYLAEVLTAYLACEPVQSAVKLHIPALLRGGDGAGHISAASGGQ